MGRAKSERMKEPSRGASVERKLATKTNRAVEGQYGVREMLAVLKTHSQRN
jgi:hypothetical protein